MRRIVPALLCLSALLGCASFDEEVRPAREAYFTGRYEEAARLLEPLVEDGGKDQPAYMLEEALPLLADGKYKKAENVLRHVRDAFDEYEKQSAFEWVQAALTDDTAIAYPGEDYEKILIRVMLALVNLLRDGKDALAYANQVIQKQVEIIDRSPEFEGKKIKANYKEIGIGRYLVGLLREEEYRYSTALTYYRKVKALEPQFIYSDEDIERARNGVHSAKGHGVLYVFALVDRGPYKVQVVDRPSTRALNMVWIMASILGKDLATPSIFPVKVPALRFPERTIDFVQVSVDDRNGRPTSEIMNVHSVAKQQFDQIKDWIIARAFLRRLLKKAIVEAGKRAVQHQYKKNSDARAAVEAGAFLVSAIWEGTEVADTRCWGTLPASIQAVRLELPVGEHVIRLVPQVAGNPAGIPAEARVMIEDDRNAYCVAIFPTGRTPPAVHVSRPPFEQPPQASVP